MNIVKNRASFAKSAKRESTTAFPAAIESLESRALLTATPIYVENFDNPTPPNGQVLFKADPVYLGAPSGGDAKGNSPYLNGLVIRNNNFAPFSTGGWGLISHDQSGSGYFLYEGTQTKAAPSYAGTFWESYTTVKVSPNTSYVFSFYLTNSDSANDNDAIVQPLINGKPLGAAVSAKGFFNDGITGDGWQKFSFNWNSGSATTADLKLVNTPRLANAPGDDFGIDTITLTAATPKITLAGPANQTAVQGVSKSVSLGSFTAVGATAPYKVTINWGDGSANTILTVPSAGVIPATAHIFAKAGSLTVSETITDANGVTSNAASFTEVVTAPPASISGEVFNDVNTDGKPDDGELGLDGWTVDLSSGGKLLATAVTNINGDFSFTGLTAGTYVVKVVQVTGTEATKPTNGTLTLTLTAGEISTGNLFGEKAIS